MKSGKHVGLFAAILFTLGFLYQPVVQAQTAGEIAFWETVSRNASPRMLRLYLEKYPDGHFSDLARVMLSDDTASDPSSSQSSRPTPRPESQNGLTECDRLATHPDDPDGTGASVSWSQLKKQSESAVQACLRAVEKKNDGRSNYQLYRAYLANDQPSFGKDYLLKAVRKGYSHARFMHAQNLADGDASFNKDIPKAVRLHLANARDGNSLSAFRAGYYLTLNKDVPADYGKALRLLKQAEKAGRKEPFYSLGWMHYAGKGVSKDPQRARYYYRKAVEAGRFGVNSSRTRLAKMIMADVENRQRNTVRPVGLSGIREAATLYRDARTKKSKSHSDYIRFLSEGIRKAHYNIAKARANGNGLSQNDRQAYQNFVADMEGRLMRALPERAKAFPSKYRQHSSKAIKAKLSSFRKVGTRSENRISTMKRFQSWYFKNKQAMKNSGGSSKYCLRTKAKANRDNWYMRITNKCPFPMTASVWVKVTSEGRKKHESTKTVRIPANGSKTRKVYYRYTSRAIRSTSRMRACFERLGAPFDIRGTKFKCKGVPSTAHQTSVELSQIMSNLRSVENDLVSGKF
ncbi:tetratricopeptide repeat protein [Cohaesibacter intestini]|uniref:tetratricopeptide repeat protein n=1 Tax=Cohaesibacter intestini TaxID=2211145 RepID=UPI0013006EE8|nr:tetratricopeptide repeat protein [Cohaesibacter intestini]